MFHGYDLKELAEVFFIWLLGFLSGWVVNSHERRIDEGFFRQR